VEILLAFGVGWVIGSRTTAEGFHEVVGALDAVRQSAEFKNLIETVRSHAVDVARDLAGQLSPDREEPVPLDDVLTRVRALLRATPPEG
jgi:hypothetical protein